MFLVKSKKANLNIFLFISASYWVYKEFRPNYDPNIGPHCDKTTYHLAFWILTIYYVLITLAVLVFITFAVRTCIVVQSAKRRRTESDGLQTIETV